MAHQGGLWDFSSSLTDSKAHTHNTWHTVHSHKITRRNHKHKRSVRKQHATLKTNKQTNKRTNKQTKERNETFPDKSCFRIKVIVREKTRAFECLAKVKIIAHGHHYFQSVNTVNTAFTSQGFSEGFSLHPHGERKITSVQKSMKTGGEEGRGVWGFTDVLARLTGIHARSGTAAPSVNGGERVSSDWTRRLWGGTGGRTSLGKEERWERGRRQLAPVLTLNLKDLIAQVCFDVIFAVGRQNETQTTRQKWRASH